MLVLLLVVFMLTMSYHTILQRERDINYYIVLVRYIMYGSIHVSALCGRFYQK